MLWFGISTPVGCFLAGDYFFETDGEVAGDNFGIVSTLL